MINKSIYLCLLSLSVRCIYSGIWRFKTYHLLPMLAGSRELSFAQGDPLGADVT